MSPELLGVKTWLSTLEIVNICVFRMRHCTVSPKISHTVVGDPWTEWLTTTKRVTRGFHAWKYIPIYSQHNIYKFSFLPCTIIDSG